ncbi:MAG: hypothetical protein ACREUL_18980 [Steroidobacteraceae bacterium]
MIRKLHDLEGDQHDYFDPPKPSCVRGSFRRLGHHRSRDAEAQAWYVAETDVPGLATEAATLGGDFRDLIGTPRHCPVL